MSFIDDLITATMAGGASRMTKPYTIKKNEKKEPKGAKKNLFWF